MFRQSTKACCPIFAVFTFEKPLLGLDDFHQMVLLFTVFRLFVRSVLAQLTSHHSEIKRLKLLSNWSKSSCIVFHVFTDDDYGNYLLLS